MSAFAVFLAGVATSCEEQIAMLDERLRAEQSVGRQSHPGDERIDPRAVFPQLRSCF